MDLGNFIAINKEIPSEKGVRKNKRVKISIHLFFLTCTRGVQNSDYRSIVSNTDTFEMIFTQPVLRWKRQPKH